MREHQTEQFDTAQESRVPICLRVLIVWYNFLLHIIQLMNAVPKTKKHDVLWNETLR